MWWPAIAQSELIHAGAGAPIALNTGVPSFIATGCVGVFTPYVPACPEQRSTVVSSTATVLPISLSISSVLRPIFCTRPWQGTW